MNANGEETNAAEGSDEHAAGGDVEGSGEPPAELLALQQVIEGVKEIGAALDDYELRPSFERTDWAAHHERIEIMDKRIRAVLLAPLESAMSVFEEGESRDNLLDAIANVIAEYAVLVHVSKAAGAPDALLAEAIGVATEGSRAPLKAALQSIDAFAHLTIARWHLRVGDRNNADAAAQRAVDAGAPNPLLQSAQAIIKAPRPLDKAPSLGSLNGFGTGLYGSRDPVEGTVVKTYCLTALFIPLIPLSAYRVMDHGGGSYSFLHKEKLSSFAKAWLVILPLLIALAIGGSSFASYMDTPKFAVPKRVAAAQKKLDAGDPRAAIAEIDNLFVVYAGAAQAEELDAASLTYAKAVASDVTEPVTAGNAKDAMTKLRRFKNLPSGAQLGAGGTFLTQKLEAWAAQVGAGSPEASRAQLALLDMAYELAPGPDARRVEEAQIEARVGVAHLLAKDWPLDAVTPYAAALPAKGAVDGLAEIFSSIPAGSSAWARFASQVDRWSKVARVTGTHDALIESATKSVADAERRAQSPARTAALSAGGKKLDKWIAGHPHDVAALSARADLALQSNRPKDAVAALTVDGGARALPLSERLLLAEALRETGDLDGAERILKPVVDTQVASFIALGKRFEARSRKIQEPILRDLRLGVAPAGLERLYGASEAETTEILTKFMVKKLENDPQLGAIKAQLAESRHVLWPALQWTHLKMARGDASSLKEARRIIDAIAPDSEGDPLFEAARARLAELGG